jgi:serine/threonine protein kinase
MPPILHRDISLGNIVLVAGDAGEQEGESSAPREALLLDFVTAREAPSGRVLPTSNSSSSSGEELTGTTLFMAYSVMQGEGHTVSSDLESLFLVLLFIATAGRVHWLNARLGTSAAAALKLEALLGDKGYMRFTRCRCKEDLVLAVDRLRALFFKPDYNTEVDVQQFLKALSG